MIASGVTHLVECGPGKVLTGLNRRIERRKEIGMFALEDSPAIDAGPRQLSGEFGCLKDKLLS